MIELLKKVIRRIKGSRPKHPLFLKLKSCLPNEKSILLDEFSIVYFIGGYKNDFRLYDQLKQVIDERANFVDFLKQFQKDLTKDNIEFYLLKNMNKFHVVALYDPYDYLKKEEVLDIYRVDEDFIEIKNLERIN